jgi:hypothetical protein
METYKGTPIERIFAFWDEQQQKLEEAKQRKAESNRRARAKYRETHREETRDQSARYYEENKAEILTSHAERYAFRKMATT